MRIAARRRTEAAFTLIELMIVVAIIGILASVALPKFALLIERARETSTRGAMSTIRSAIALYYADTEGTNPTMLDPVTESSFSRYLDTLPPVKATHSGIGGGIGESPSGAMVLYTTDEDIAASGAGWRYNSNNGHLFVNSSSTDTKGIPYSTYGY